MQPEGKVIKAIRDYVTSNGGVVYKLHGGGYSTRGLPDLLIVWNGRTTLVETKVKGKKPEPHQLARINEINSHGGTSFWTDSLDDFKEKYGKRN